MTVPAPPPVSVPVPDPANAWDILNAIAQSIGALGTMGALIVAAAVYRRQVEDQRRDQARRVFVRMDIDQSTLIQVANDSELPIFHVSVIGHGTFSAVGHGHAHGKPYRRWFTAEAEVALAAFDEVRPGQIVTQEHSHAETTSPDYRLRVTFEDAAGRRWDRWRTGELHPVQGRPGDLPPPTLLGVARDYLSSRKQVRRRRPRRPRGRSSLNP